MNYRYVDSFKEKQDEWIIEYGIHDTFDALSPKYDIPLSVKKFKKIAKEVLADKRITYEFIETKGITLLRNKDV